MRLSRRRLVSVLEAAQLASLRSAAREQDLDAFVRRLCAVVPDISDQYSTFVLDTRMLTTKVRAQQAFQTALALAAVDRILAEPGGAGAGSPLRIVDIGDSSGTHVTYLRAILDDGARLRGRALHCLSVNIDPAAVERIRAKGLPAVLGRAGDLNGAGWLDADLFLAFELLEHLTDPVAFLDVLSRQARGEYLVATVPYLRQSRVGLHHIRQGRPRTVYPENTHIFELSPPDWRLIFSHAGWEPVYEQVYLQYPRWGVWRVMRIVWKVLDFEGFYGVIARRNRSWAECFRAG